MEGYGGVDHCWDGMTFSAVDEFLSVAGVESVDTVPGKEEVLYFDGTQDEVDDSLFMDDLLLKVDDVVPTWTEENEIAGDLAHDRRLVAQHQQQQQHQQVQQVHANMFVDPETVVGVDPYMGNMGHAEAVVDYNSVDVSAHKMNGQHLVEMIGDDGDEHEGAVSEPFPTKDEMGTMEALQHAKQEEKLDGQHHGTRISISPVSNSPGDQSPLLGFNEVAEKLSSIPKGRKNLKSRRTGRSVSEKFITKAASKTRIYANPTASHFCHICWRRAKYTPMAVCSNIQFSSCRKVICKKCFIYYKWDWDKANEPNSSFQCTHCLNTCPEGAQCYTYGKTNLKRRSSRTKGTPVANET